MNKSFANVTNLGNKNTEHPAEFEFLANNVVSFYYKHVPNITRGIFILKICHCLFKFQFNWGIYMSTFRYLLNKSISHHCSLFI